MKKTPFHQKGWLFDPHIFMNANSKTLTHKRTLHHPVQHETKLNLQFPLSNLNSEEMLKSGSGTEYDLNLRKEKSEKKLVIKSLFLAFGIKMKILFKGKWKKGMSVNANVNMSILYINCLHYFQDSFPVWRKHI